MRTSWILAFFCFAMVIIGILSFPKTGSAQAESGFDTFKADLQAIQSKTQATLLFSPFGSNPDFKRHALHDTQVAELCGGGGGNTCGNLGVNFGTLFTLGKIEKADQFKMQYTLEIADAGKAGDVIKGLNDARTVNGIVRIGIATSSIGFQKWNADPNNIAGDYINFLNSVASGVSKDFYAIAGPNEPDIEAWFAPECGRFDSDPKTDQTFYDCIGPKLAAYMNAVCAAKPANVKLLSPAFNLTSSSFNGIFTSMKDAGANFKCIDAFAGNLYPAGQSMQKYWTDQDLDRFKRDFGRPLIITETGPMKAYAGSSGSNIPNLSNSPSLFHLSPLEGIYPDPGRRNYAQIRQDLVEQGYQAYCAIPEQTLTGSVGPSDLVDLFVNNGGQKTLELRPILTLDYSLSRTPLFRDNERKFELKSDIEEYWSYQEPLSSTYSQAELSSAPIESLLNETQRCGEGVKNLLAQDSMCSKLVDPSSCALYSFPINNTLHTIKSLLGEYRTQGGTNNTIRTTCERIENSTVESEKKLFSDLTQVPLTIERGFRLAFLVLSLEELKPNPKAIFHFFAHGTQPRDEVLVIAFKIPDVISNKPTSETALGGSAAYPLFSDGAMLARDSLLTTHQQEKQVERITNKKTELTENVNSVLSQSDASAIYCLNGAPPNGTGSISCNDQLVKALTDLINAQANISQDQLSCVGRENIDESYIIDEPAALQSQSPKSLFPDELGKELISQLFLNLASTSTDSLAREFASTFLINKETVTNGKSKSTKITSYLVYPVGYELHEVENVLANSFLTKEQIAYLDDDPNNNEKFELFGGTSKLKNTESSFEFFEPGCRITPGDSCMRTITGTIAFDILKPIQFLGAKLGYYLRAIQRTLAKEASGVQTYLASCKTTEEFLLNQCGSVQQKQPQQSLSYCGMNELVITNQTTENFEICGNLLEQDGCSQIDKGSDRYFLDGSSRHSLQLSSRILDGATLVTTGSIVTMNPGQNYTEGDSMARCGVGKDNYSTTLILWYLPPTVPHEETKNYETWRKQATRMSILTGTNVWTNAVISLQVKPGYYHIAHETYECTARGVIWINKSGQESSDITTFEFDTSVIPIGITNKGRTSYCAKVTHNSNMPGGPDGGEDVRMKESYSCPVAGKGYNIMLNTSCGGLNGADDLQLWHELFTPDDESGENKLPGLGAYEKIFGRKFVLPNEDSTSCDDLFPNTIREVGCDEVSNSDIGSVAQFGANVDAEFGMEYWNGSTVQFRPPSQEIWSAIQAASAKHGCDPLLVLAVAHSESSGYRNDTVSSADARGVWQFTPGTWDTWRIPYVASADNCNKHQPATFSTEGLDFSSPTNIVAAADSACRKIMWIGMQRYPNDVNSFERVFAINGDNPYSQIWNAHTAQGNYVWRLWGELRSRLSTQALPHPANYPLPGWESCSARRN